LQKRGLQTKVLPDNINVTIQLIRGALRAFRLACVLSAVAITILILYPWLEASALLRYRQGQRRISTVFHRVMRALLGLRIHEKGAPSSIRPLIVIANHTSWLDIIVIESVLPAIFVTKREVAGWPVFGRLAKLKPSIFVDRNRRLQILETINSISTALVAGKAVAIFPEGTSTDGTGVLPFRSALFGAVHETLHSAERLPAIFIQPVSVAYVGPERRLAVWALEDEIKFFPHLLQVVGLHRIEVALTWGEPIPADMSCDRKILAKRVEEAVRRMVAEANESQALPD
jgi:1-acyl-sn-glycerol-3-phosphate acyltransferase